jgi:hypothetical protein
MAERQIFKHEPGMGSEARDHGPQKRRKDIEHNGPTLADDTEKSTFAADFRVFATDRTQELAIRIVFPTLFIG